LTLPLAADALPPMDGTATGVTASMETKIDTEQPRGQASGARVGSC
jgi:hypothetical protein